MRFAREAWPFVLPCLGLTLLLAWWFGIPGALIGSLLALGVLLFFRDPKRTYEGPEEMILAPADGLVTAVDRVREPLVGPGELDRVVTFLSVFDVHVQRAPVSGTVTHSQRTEGRKVAAFREDADRVNESHLTVLDIGDGRQIGIRQIAGLLARRVVAYLAPGDRAARGDHLGLIKFGSRVDLVLPPGCGILVKKGDRLRNGETPVARLGSAYAAPAATPGKGSRSAETDGRHV